MSDKNNNIAEDSTKVKLRIYIPALNPKYILFQIAFDYLSSSPTNPVSLTTKKFSSFDGNKDPAQVIDQGKIKSFQILNK